MDTQMWGADPDALDALSRDLDAAAQRLLATAQRLTSRVRVAPWGGADGLAFTADWNGPHSRHISAATGSLHQAAELLRRNAAQQRTASAAAGGALAGPGGPAGPGGSGGPWQWVPGALSDTAGGLGDLGDLGTRIDILNRIRSGTYNDTFTALQKTFPRLTHDGDAFRYLKYPFAEQIQNLVQAPSKASDVLKTLEKWDAGKYLGYAGLGGDGVGMLKSGVEHDLSGVFGGGVDLFSDGLKTTKNPLTYLAGVDVALWKHVVEDAQQVDWSYNGMRDVVTAGPSGWWDGLKYSAIETPKQVLDSIF